MTLASDQFTSIVGGVRDADPQVRLRSAAAYVDVATALDDEQATTLLLEIAEAASTEEVVRTREEQLDALSEAASVGRLPESAAEKVRHLDAAVLTVPEKESLDNILSDD